jgi:hypothetical protein
LTSASVQTSSQNNGLLIQAVFALLAVMLFVFAGINLFSNFRPVATANNDLANKVIRSILLDDVPRHDLLVEVSKQQEALLLQNPIEPYAWMRLSFARKMTDGNPQNAFNALRFADSVAQPDSAGGLERIMMWHSYADIHTDADKKREREMWRQAFRADWPNLYKTIAANRLHHVFDVAIEEDPVLLEKLNKTRKH